MKAFAVIFIAFSVFALSAVSSSAGRGQDRQEVELNTPGISRTLVLPAPADNSPMISLGQAIDPVTGQMVEGYAILHPKKGAAKPDGVGKPVKPPKDETSNCWEPLARGAVWKSVEPWLVDPANTAGLDEAYVFARLVGDVDKWEDATDGKMDGVAAADIFGAASLASGVMADSDAPDGLNEVLFGDLEQPGVIAVTIVWGIFGGPPKGRYLAEWDMVFDQVDFDWSAVGAAGAMDFENIATHELGHAFGLGHPDASCVDETMYAYASYGETKKRDLNLGDITGANSLY